MYILYNRLITALNEKKPDSTEFYIAKMMIWNLWELPRMSIKDVCCFKVNDFQVCQRHWF